MTVSASATVTLISNSTEDMYGYLYNNTFNPLYPQLNLLSEDDDGASNDQFYIQMALDPYVSYVLVVTTFSANVTAPFEVSVYSLGVAVQLNPIYVQPTGKSTV